MNSTYFMNSNGRLGILHLLGSIIIVLLAFSPAISQPIERPQVQTGQKTPWLFQYPSDKLPPVGRGVFNVKLISPKMPLKNGPLQEIIISLATREGHPVSHATIKLAGKARDLKRRLPTNPQVLAKPEAGMYHVVGLRFTMRGRWLLLFDITHRKTRDKARLEINVE